MKEGTVSLTKKDCIATIIFNRLESRNSLTLKMYRELMEHCTAIRRDPHVRAVVFRGAGDKAFIAGTDISHFLRFESGQDGIAYERQISTCVEAIETLPVPTVALVQGWAAGGGLLVATACDFRVATDDARFAAPMAATVGNTLSAASVARLISVWGVSRVRRMLLLAEAITAQEAYQCGFLYSICTLENLECVALDLIGQLTALAPLTQAAVKETIRRLTEDRTLDDDLIRLVYESEDFAEGVRAFLSHRPPIWTKK